MKIAIVIDGLAVGGAERQAVVAAAELSRRGHDVELISYGPRNDYADRIAQAGVRLVQIASRGPLRIARLRALTRHLRRGRFDVAYAFKRTSSIWGRMAAKLAGVPRIFGGYRGLTGQGRFARWLNRRLTRNTAGWIVNSNSVKEFVVRDLGLSPEKVFVVPNAVEPSEFQSPLTCDQARSKFGLTGRTPVVSIIANLRAVKNHAMFLRAARRILEGGKPATFLLAGQGPLREQLEATCRQYRIDGSVRFLAQVREIPDLLRASDIVALSSFTEGLPNTLIEAGAAGLPCVSSDNGGAGDVILDGTTGFLVPVDDDEAMAERIGRLLDQPALRERMGAAARVRMLEKFSPAALGDNLLRLWGECLKVRDGKSKQAEGKLGTHPSFRDAWARYVSPPSHRKLGCVPSFPQRQWDVAIWGTYPPPWGGMATHIVRLMGRLEREGIRARVFNRASDGQDPPRAISIRSRQKRWFLRFALFAPEPVLYVFTGRPLVRFLAWVLKVLRGKRYILRIGEERLLETLTKGSFAQRWATLVALRGAEYVVAVSPHLAEPVLRAGIPAERVRVIPGFIPPGDLSEEPPREAVEFARKHTPVLSANGQIWMRDGQDAYGLDLLLQALAAIKKDYLSVGLMLSLYGDSPRIEGLGDLEGKIAAMGLRESVLIRAEPHVFWPMLKHSDIFLRPTRTEGDSGSIREAIYLGVPVIASDATPRPAPSVLFRNGDSEELAAAVRKVLKDLPAYKRRFEQAQLEDNAAPVIALLKDCLRR